MKSVFENPKAIAPFFDDILVVEGRRAAGRDVRCTVRACVLDHGFSDPLLNGASAASEARELAVQLPRNFWPYTQPPQIGDRVKLASGQSFEVYKVGLFDATVYILSIREAT